LRLCMRLTLEFRFLGTNYEPECVAFKRPLTQ
jgi:hypothetical protein